MRTLLRTVLWIVVGAVVVIALTASFVAIRSNHILHRHFTVEVTAVPLPTSPEAIARGRHLATIRGCVACHGEDAGGAMVMDNSAMGRVYGPNLTGGMGGLRNSLSAEDWVRAIRHGVATDGHPLVIMPSKDYTALSDQDLGEIIAYLRSLPPVDRTVPTISMGPVFRALLAFGKFRLSADLIDHSRSESARAVAAAPTAAYGRYLVTTCTGCHNAHLSGGKIIEGPPDWPPAANLTSGPGSAVRGWSEAQFMAALRTMRDPSGRRISPVMPTVFGQMSDTELKALWSYLQTLPPAPAGKAP